MSITALDLPMQQFVMDYAMGCYVKTKLLVAGKALLTSVRVENPILVVTLYVCDYNHIVTTALFLNSNVL